MQYRSIYNIQFEKEAYKLKAQAMAQFMKEHMLFTEQKEDEKVALGRILDGLLTNIFHLLSNSNAWNNTLLPTLNQIQLSTKNGNNLKDTKIPDRSKNSAS